jgi:membrane dipeptidase
VYLTGPGKKRFLDSLSAVYTDPVLLGKKWEEYFARELNKVRPATGDVVDHIDHIVRLVGDDFVGIGADYDGVSSVPVGLEDVTTYPRITQELLKRGYSRKSIRKILGANVLRVMKANFE